MAKANKPTSADQKAARFIAYSFLGLLLLILAAVTIRIVLWVLGVEL